MAVTRTPEELKKVLTKYNCDFAVVDGPLKNALRLLFIGLNEISGAYLQYQTVEKALPSDLKEKFERILPKSFESYRPPSSKKVMNATIFGGMEELGLTYYAADGPIYFIKLPDGVSAFDIFLSEGVDAPFYSLIDDETVRFGQEFSHKSNKEQISTLEEITVFLKEYPPLKEELDERWPNIVKEKQTEKFENNKQVIS